MPINGHNPPRPWGPREPLDHRRLNAGEERNVTDITVGPGMVMARNGNTVAIGLGKQRQLTRDRVRVTVGLAVDGRKGWYHGRRYFGGTSLAATGDLTPIQLGTIATTNDCFVLDIAQADNLDDALPLSRLTTVGWYTGVTGEDSKPIIEIPPPGIRKLRWNSTTHKIEAAYSDNPATDADWVDYVTFDPC